MNRLVIIDAGNTNIKGTHVKLGYFDMDAIEEEIICSSQLLIDDLQKAVKAFDKWMKNNNLGDKDHFVIMSPSKLYENKIEDILIYNFGIKSGFSMSHDDFRYIQTKFPKENYGLDILALASYASIESNNCMAFMFGTASVAIKIYNKTIEATSIAPGIGLSFDALQNKLKKSSSGNREWNYRVDYSNKMGTNTQEALNSGAYNMFLGFIITHIFSNIEIIGRGTLDVYITGGDLQNEELIKKDLQNFFKSVNFHVGSSMVTKGVLYSLSKQKK
ncbi:type III pantothenate kinase [Mycoplasmopsis columboralis]|uniref:type III pantothenate kinase n=1 Tax=Mycoplasmopsis columboralis TaxID=171282 RepID=UPI00055A41C0|nr:type III pantothenate kinase [Mycoplasmopsis columboralis]